MSSSLVFSNLPLADLTCGSSYGYWATVTVCLVMDRRQGYSFRQTGLRILGTNHLMPSPIHTFRGLTEHEVCPLQEQS